MAKYSDDAQYVSAFNKSLVAANRAKLLLADLNKAEPDSDNAISLKARYDASKAEYDRYEAIRLARKTILDAPEKRAESEKKKKKQLAPIEAEIPQIEYRIQVAKNSGDTAAQTKAEAELQAARNEIAGIKTPQNNTDIDEGLNSEEVANNKFKDYTVLSTGAVTNKLGNSTYFVGVKNADGTSTMQEYESVIKARDAFLKNYSAPGAIDILKQKSGVDSMIAKYTYDSVTAVKYGNAKEAPLIDTWFTSSKGGSGGSGKGGTFRDSDIDLTTIGDAYQEINDYMVDALGREATQEEKDAYYKDINKQEKASAVKTVAVRDASGKITNTTRTGSFVTEDERLNTKNSIVIKALEGTDAGELLKSSKGSQVAVQIAALQKAGADYGQPLSAGEALKYVISGGTQKDALAKQTERMRLNSMTIYGNLKDHIRDGGNVKDIADQYALIKAKKLGIPVTDAFNDKDVQSALTRNGGLMSTAEFSRQMQANPLWRQTEEARNVASNFADTILKSFGFMG
jgi:hypothetical protein